MKKFYFWSLLLGLTFGSMALTACGDDDDDPTPDPVPTPVVSGGEVDSRLVGTWVLIVEGMNPHHPSFTFKADGTGYQQFTMNPDEQYTQIERRGGTYTTIGDSLIRFTYKYMTNEIYDNENKKTVEKNTDNYPQDQWWTDSIPYYIRGNSLFMYNGSNEFKKQ